MNKNLLLRSGVLDLALAAALPVATQVATLTGRGRAEVEQARAAEGPVTPASQAFVIWAPIFASLLGYGAQRLAAPSATRDPAAIALVRTALLGNILWSLNAQFRSLDQASVALITASAAPATAALARFEALSPRNPGARLAANLIAPLAGWLSVATFANLDATQRLTGRTLLDPESTVAVATAATAAGAVASRGNILYAAAGGWGLAGIAYKNRLARPSLTRAAIIGLGAVVVATAIGQSLNRLNGAR
jgi:tryptophan-rich sensory protein